MAVLKYFMVHEPAQEKQEDRMMRIGGLAWLIISLLSCAMRGQAALADSIAPAEISFETSDGIRIMASLIQTPSPKFAPTVLLLHQAGSNGRGEYSTLAPKLSEQGLNVMLVDLRSGGEAFGQSNRTVQLLGDAEFGYCDAYPDIEAAVRELGRRGMEGPLFIWGSSYSAALAINYAAQNPSIVRAYLAFSPASGPPMAGCEPESLAAKAAAGMVLRPESEMQFEWIAAQMDNLRQSGAQTLVVPGGVHGSSMLVDDRTHHDMSDYRRQVYQFIIENSAR